ncbi:hypothetical protein DFH09DRAFT_1175470 [Mycena vulgaris]|nr:hypothetical protein DFH09DRAFT_1175470 [Mycena vulgaris]
MSLDDARATMLFRLMGQASLTRSEGEKLFDAGQFSAAKVKYLEDIAEVAGAAFTVPMIPGSTSGGVISDVYIQLNPWKRANLMGWCVGMARCLRREGKIEMALAWCEEVNALYRCTYYLSPEPLYDWIDLLILPEMTLMKSAALSLASEIFAGLGNSGTATTRRWNAHKTTKTAPVEYQTPALHAILNRSLRNKMLESRHPDPHAPLSMAPCVAGLQVRGSWTRLNVVRLVRRVDKQPVHSHAHEDALA